MIAAHPTDLKRRLQLALTSNPTYKVLFALYAYTASQQLLQWYRSFVLLRRTFPHQSFLKTFQSALVYSTIIFLGDTTNLLIAFAAPKLALTTLGAALRFSKRDFRYGPHARNVLDLYGVSSSTLPPHRPVVIFIHGGAWALSSKFHYAAVGESLARRDVVTVVPSYRTFPHGDVHDMQDDLRAIVQWTVANIATYGGDPARIFLCGHSSGAHLCALLLVQSAIRDTKAHTPNEEVHHIRAFVGLSGPYDMSDHFDFESNRDIIPFVRAHGISPLHPSMHGQRKFQAHSPSGLVRYQRDLAPMLPPIYLIHGTDDAVVPPTSTLKFADYLNEIGANVTVVEFPADHMEPLLALMDACPRLNDDIMQAFLQVVSPMAADAMLPPSKL
ncbi:Aste57867_23753 [Aphanomyces stellatus]|uniref:Aste57867_23753 protein n=1 Tax=Aphanomyces stellatus TaxID=120398 RepID=A0A485LPB8_9STRA|nr:hypothetical protein As57867_023681 [Aphanomyces stellatus]VFU00398.1 Aste57867_23753 [Aphanomyces stellatus]